VHSDGWSVLATRRHHHRLLSDIDLRRGYRGFTVDDYDVNGGWVKGLKKRMFYSSLLLIIAVLLVASSAAYKGDFVQFPEKGPRVEDTLSQFMLRNMILDVLIVGFVVFATIVCCTAILREDVEW